MLTKDRIKASSSRLDSDIKPDILDWTSEQRYLSGQTLTQAQPITDNTVFNVFQFTKCKQILFSAVFADKYSCQWSYSKNIYLFKHFIFKFVSFSFIFFVFVSHLHIIMMRRSLLIFTVMDSSLTQVFPSRRCHLFIWAMFSFEEVSLSGQCFVFKRCRNVY